MALPDPNASATALVTGASSGIGAEIARELARRGHGVTLVARTESRLSALADELTGAHGVRTEVVVADLGDPASRSALLHEIGLRGLTVDVLVNNAGYSTTGPVARSDGDSPAVRAPERAWRHIRHVASHHELTDSLSRDAASTVFFCRLRASTRPMPV